eukprot:Gb_37081 [translate_table: standard]
MHAKNIRSCNPNGDDVVEKESYDKDDVVIATCEDADVPMPYSNATRREMSHRRRNEITVEEVENASQQAHDRYGVQPTPSHIYDAQEYPTPSIIRSPMNNINDGSSAGGAHLIRCDAISSHRHLRILLRSDPNNIVQRSASVEAIPAQSVFNHNRGIDRCHHESHCDDVQNNVSNFSAHAVHLLLEHTTNIVDRLSIIVLEISDPVLPLNENVNISCDYHIDSIHHPTSFASRRPNTLREMEQIRVWLETSEDEPVDLMEWPDLGASPINEYNTEGLFDMAFPTLFPTGKGKWLQPRSMKICAIFVKKNTEESLAAIIHELRAQLETLPDACLAEKVMKFGTTLRGTYAYWSKCLCELSDMIHQIGCPTIFFTLSVIDMQWPDLHQLMPRTPPWDPTAARKWHCNNVIQHPHIVAKYMHLHYTIFREEVLTKFHVTNGSTEGLHIFIDSYGCAMLLIWIESTGNMRDKANVDWKPMTSTYVVLKYIAKSAIKSEKVSESYRDMLLRISSIEDLEEPAARAYKRFLSETIRHHGFVLPDNSFIHAYMECPPQMERLPLIEVARSWTYSERQKNEPWKSREKEVVVRVWPRFHVTPFDDSEQFEEFYWSELVLYKPFHSFDVDIGIVKEVIIERWRSLRYHAWHIKRAEEEKTLMDDDDEEIEFHRSETNRDQDEWEIISGLMNASKFLFTDLDIFGQCDFDINHDWHADYDDPDTSRCVVQFLLESRWDNAIHRESAPPLRLIIQGIAGTGKSYLIKAIRIALESAAFPLQMPLLLLAPTGIAAFNISSMTIHSALQIPIKDMKALQGELLMVHINKSMGLDDVFPFYDAIHLFSMNALVHDHNQHRLKCLNVLVARSIVEKMNQSNVLTVEDEKLDVQVLIGIGVRVMLTSNLWIDAGLMNGALGHVRNIVYNSSVQPLCLPTYVLMEFDNYIGNAWDPSRPRGLTLDLAIVDIGNIERQGLTFIAISRVRDLNSLRIVLPFSFECYARMGDSPQVNTRKKEE